MRSTIDKAGRLVIPKALRDMLGLVPGEVEVTPEGAGLHIEPLAGDSWRTKTAFETIPAADSTISAPRTEPARCDSDDGPSS